MVEDKLRLRACAVCVHDGQVLLVQLCDPGSGARFVVPPGGAIEAGETPAGAAVRETLEETGCDVVLSPIPPVVARYRFVWNGVPYAVTTHFYLAQLTKPCDDFSQVQDAPYVEGACWCPLVQVPQALAFHADIREAVTRLLVAGGHRTA